MALTVIPLEQENFKIDEKRFCVPFVMQSTCPQCQQVRTMDLSGDNYLAYPKLGVVASFWFNCRGCGREWSEQYSLEITLTAI